EDDPQGLREARRAVGERQDHAAAVPLRRRQAGEEEPRAAPRLPGDALVPDELPEALRALRAEHGPGGEHVLPPVAARARARRARLLGLLRGELLPRLWVSDGLRCDQPRAGGPRRGPDRRRAATAAQG